MTLGRLVFAGTPAFAVPCFEALRAAGADIALVLTQPDRRAGRGRHLTPPPVKAAATAAGVTVAQPPKLTDPGLLEGFGPPPDALIVVAYGLILPAWLLTWPRCGAINVHASLLPRWRGAAPIQRALLAGDSVTGISIMQMDQGLDTGPVLASVETAISPAETNPELHDRLATLGAQTLVDTLPSILAGSAKPTPQADSNATYAHKISKAEARIDWQRSAVEIDRQIRAFAGWPVAESALSDGRRLRIWGAELLDQHARLEPGYICAATPAGIDVAAGAGIIRITDLQPPASRAMSAAAYLAAHSLAQVAFVSG